MGSEIWKDVVGYEGLYQVSNLGRVKGLDRKARPVECLKDGVVIKTYQSALEAEKVDGFSSRNIAHCCNHRYRHKRHKGFEWRYVTTKQ